MEELPRWEAGTPAVLCAYGPHAIPVSTVVRASGKRVLFALARSRETLERIRQHPAVALCVMAEGLAFTAHGHAAVVEEAREADAAVRAGLARLAST